MLEMYATQLPKIAAEESLRRASEIALGSGSLEARDQRQLVRDWQNAAGGTEQVRRASTMAEVAVAARAMGITVVTEPAQAATAAEED